MTASPTWLVRRDENLPSGVAGRLMRERGLGLRERHDAVDEDLRAVGDALDDLAQAVGMGRVEHQSGCGLAGGGELVVGR